MKAGFFKKEITPPAGYHMSGKAYPRIAQDVHDPLNIRAIAFQEERLAVVMVVDIVGLYQDKCNEIRDLLHRIWVSNAETFSFPAPTPIPALCQTAALSTRRMNLLMNLLLQLSPTTPFLPHRVLLPTLGMPLFSAHSPNWKTLHLSVVSA